jgi:hypothetical protein
MKRLAIFWLALGCLLVSGHSPIRSAEAAPSTWEQLGVSTSDFREAIARRHPVPAVLGLGIKQPFYGGNPLTILGTCVQLWLRGDLGITISSGSSISAWADQSGHGDNATEATGSLQPTQGTTINGQPTVNFSGSQGMRLSGFPTTDGAKFVAVVYQLISIPATSTDGVIYAFPSSTPEWSLQFLLNVGGIDPFGTFWDMPSIGGGKNGASTMIALTNSLDTSAHALAVSYNGAGPTTASHFAITLNGSTQSPVAQSVSSSVNSTNPASLASVITGSNPDIISFALNIAIGEMIVCNGTQPSASQLSSLGNYFQAHWGIQ